MKKNTKVLFGGGLIGAAILLLLVAATPGSSGVEATLQALQENPAKYSEANYVMTQGNIIGDSIKWDANKIEIRFDVQDEQGNVLHVIHNGVKPDNFSEGIIAILEGKLNAEGVFEAEKVKTRCPSKYEGQDMKNYDPEKHKQIQKESAESK